MTHTFLHPKLHLPGFHARTQCLVGPPVPPWAVRMVHVSRVISFLHSSIL